MEERVESYFCYSASTRYGQTPYRSDDSAEDFLFVVSGCNTPVIDTSPAEPGAHAHVAAAARHLHHRHTGDETQHGSPRNNSQATSPVYDTSPIERSRPIATEGKRSKSTGPVDDSSAQHPSEPYLSAKGTARGHQRSTTEADSALPPIRETNARSNTSHPTGLTSHDVQRPPPAPAARTADARTRGVGDPRRGALSPTRVTATRVDAYNPTGIPGSAALLGKYYPSNYEAPEAAGSSLQSRGSASYSSVPLSGVNQERQLQQYKRDMINQTLHNAREALGRTLQSQASIKAVETMLDEGARKSAASGFALLSRYKPSSPRITPLLSPGPVTPMALDEGAESDYLTVRGTASSR